MTPLELELEDSSHHQLLSHISQSRPPTVPGVKVGDSRRLLFLQLSTGCCGCILLLVIVLLAVIGAEDLYAAVWPSADRNSVLSVSVSDKGAVTISLGSEVWLQTEAQAYLRSNGSLQLLELQAAPNINHDEDYLGSFEQHEFIMSSTTTPDSTIVCRVKVYDSSDTVVFEQHFPRAVDGVSAMDPDEVVSAWPVVVPSASARLGFAHWISWVYGSDSATQRRSQKRDLLVAPGFNSPQIGQWSSHTSLQGGIGGTGVIAFFNDNSENAIVISPQTNPMVINHVSNPGGGLLLYGVMGNVSSIPANFSISILVSGSNKGVNAAMGRWGDQMRAKSGGVKVERESDVSLNWLGYSTDNGQFYYYHSENRTKSSLDTLVDLKMYSENCKIPIRYLLLDSWWYHHGVNDGVKAWSASWTSELYQNTNWWIQAHNRYWAPDVVYAKSNGGMYNFVVTSTGAVPDDEAFWPWLFAHAKSNWGLAVYEQDWLFNELYYSGSLLKDVSSSQRWLSQMAAGAYAEGITVQYCMPHIRFLFQSVDYPAVTQARATDDYRVAPYDGPSNWRIFGQSVMLTALGLATSKDGFWSTSRQAENPYGRDFYEPCPRLQAAVATISRGPVQIGDGIGNVDVELVAKSHTQNGRLLQASNPCLWFDLIFKERAFRDAFATTEGCFSSTWIDGEFFAGYLFAADSSLPLQIMPEDLISLGFPSTGSFIAAESNSTVATLQGFSRLEPISLRAPSVWDFNLWQIVPVLPRFGWSFLGELDKWIRVSPTRVSSIHETERDGILVYATGSESEVVKFEFSSPRHQLVIHECIIKTSTLQISAVRGCIVEQ